MSVLHLSTFFIVKCLGPLHEHLHLVHDQVKSYIQTQEGVIVDNRGGAFKLDRDKEKERQNERETNCEGVCFRECASLKF